MTCAVDPWIARPIGTDRPAAGSRSSRWQQENVVFSVGP